MITMHPCLGQTDRQTYRQTNEHHGKSATIRSNERIARVESVLFFQNVSNVFYFVNVLNITNMYVI